MADGSKGVEMAKVALLLPAGLGLGLAIAGVGTGIFGGGLGNLGDAIGGVFMKHPVLVPLIVIAMLGLIGTGLFMAWRTIDKS